MSAVTKAQLELSIADHLRDIRENDGELDSWSLTMGLKSIQGETSLVVYITEEG